MSVIDEMVTDSVPPKRIIYEMVTDSIPPSESLMKW